jgi:hypothetical protein
MFEPELEAVNKRVDRLTEYTSMHADLLIDLLNMVEFLHATLLKVQSEDYRDTMKFSRKELVKNQELLKDEVQYLRDKVFEKTIDPLKHSSRL